MIDLSLRENQDASRIVQEAIDAGQDRQHSVVLPTGTYRFDRPVYLCPGGAGGLDLCGSGRGTTLYPGNQNQDLFVAMPQAHRYHWVADHVVPSPFPGRWAFRTHRTAGIRVSDGPFDRHKVDARFWSGVRKFSVEWDGVIHQGGGDVCGIIRTVPGGEIGAQSPWRIQVVSYAPGRIGFIYRLENGPPNVVRFDTGPLGVRRHVRLLVNLDAGTVVCEVDGAAVPRAEGVPPPPGSVFVENPGHSFWLGGSNGQDGGPPLGGAPDMTFNTFRLWDTDAPPPRTNYDPFQWVHQSLVYFTFADAERPRRGDPAVRYTGHATGFGFLTPWNGSGGDHWAKGLRVRDLNLQGSYFGSALSITSALNIEVHRIRTERFSTGVRVFGGPLPNYPLRMSDIESDYCTDTPLRIHRAAFVAVNGLSVRYPKRHVAHVIDSDMHLTDVFHAPGGGPNSVKDCLYLYRCSRVTVDRWCSNYEDGVGPGRSYFRIEGDSDTSDPTQLFRFRQIAAESLSPGKKYLDLINNHPGARLLLDDAFRLPDFDGLVSDFNAQGL